MDKRLFAGIMLQNPHRAWILGYVVPLNAIFVANTPISFFIQRTIKKMLKRCERGHVVQVPSKGGRFDFVFVILYLYILCLQRNTRGNEAYLFAEYEKGHHFLNC